MTNSSTGPRSIDSPERGARPEGGSSSASPCPFLHAESLKRLDAQAVQTDAVGFLSVEVGSSGAGGSTRDGITSDESTTEEEGLDVLSDLGDDHPLELLDSVDLPAGECVCIFVELGWRRGRARGPGC
jgi:hypothetical protein